MRKNLVIVALFLLPACRAEAPAPSHAPAGLSLCDLIATAPPVDLGPEGEDGKVCATLSARDARAIVSTQVLVVKWVRVDGELRQLTLLFAPEPTREQDGSWIWESCLEPPARAGAAASTSDVETLPSPRRAGARGMLADG